MINYKEDPRPEDRWHDAGRARLEELHAWVIDQGSSRAIANGLVGWIVAGAAADVGSTATIAGYRKALREYGPPAGHGPGQRARRRTSTGRKLVSIAVGVMLGGGIVAATEARPAAAEISPENPAEAPGAPVEISSVPRLPIILRRGKRGKSGAEASDSDRRAA